MSLFRKAVTPVVAPLEPPYRPRRLKVWIDDKSRTSFEFTLADTDEVVLQDPITISVVSADGRTVAMARNLLIYCIDGRELRAK